MLIVLSVCRILNLVIIQFQSINLYPLVKLFVNAIVSLTRLIVSLTRKAKPFSIFELFRFQIKIIYFLDMREVQYSIEVIFTCITPSSVVILRFWTAREKRDINIRLYPPTVAVSMIRLL
jgi:hypothetical protein